MKKVQILLLIIHFSFYCNAQSIINFEYLNDSTIILNGQTDILVYKLEFYKNKEENWETNTNTFDYNNSKINDYSFDFYPNGNIKAIKSTYYNDSFEIIVKLYSNRIIKEKGYYFINKITSNPIDKIQIGIPVSVSVINEYIKDNYWKYYNELGVLIKEELWDKGKLLSTKTN